MSVVQICEQEMKSDPLLEHPQVRMDQPVVYYDIWRKDYWILNSCKEWIMVNESSLRRQLRGSGFSANQREGEPLSELEECLNKIQLQFGVWYAGPLAGYQKGPREICRQQILVTSSPNLIEPQQGQFPILQKLLEDLFHADQLPYVFGWLKVAYESLRLGHLRPGQVLVLAGERNSGKSLFQNIITEILGGRAAKPYRYMSGGTEFNGELFGAEHLMIEDENASTDIRARRHFGTRIKEFTVNVLQSCHAKNRQAISLKPFWRLTVSLNEEPENLQILPPFDDSLGDKIILLRVFKAGLPMPTFTPDEREIFWRTLLEELPAFLDHLISWEIPANLRCQRFGIQHYHDPKLLTELNELAPETKLLALIDAVLFEVVKGGVEEYNIVEQEFHEGTAEEIQGKLQQSVIHEYEIKRLLSWTNAMGTYLGRLATKYPDRVSTHRTSSQRLWRINRPQRNDAVTPSSVTYPPPGGGPTSPRTEPSPMTS